MKNNIVLILDGWGHAPDWGGNAISLAKTPFFDNLWGNYPHTLLTASGEPVGLPPGSKGNSETGHLNIGAGRTVRQDISLITALIENGSFFANKNLLKALINAKDQKSSIHLMGLLGNGGIHSHIDHLFALLDLLKKYKAERVYLHLFTDGRDTEPKEAFEFLSKLENKMKETKVGQVASVIGRFYAMDRDSRWERIQAAYDLIVHGKGETAQSAEEAIKKAYEKNVTDEFISPTIILDKNNNRKNVIKDGDSVIFFNIRPDRARQLTSALVDEKFKSFDRGKFLKKLCFVTFVAYRENLPVLTLIQPEKSSSYFAQVISDCKFKQLHVAETEKYAHITYYLDGGNEKKLPGEDWYLFPSPKVQTYDLKPEMSLELVTKYILEKIKKKSYDFIIANFANPDMVGHTGNITAGIKAVEFTDKCLGLILKEIDKTEGMVILTADHGNIEQMINPSNGMPDTEHTGNPVPFIIYNPKKKVLIKNKILDHGILADIATTTLNLVGEKPSGEMSDRKSVV